MVYFPERYPGRLVMLMLLFLTVLSTIGAGLQSYVVTAINHVMRRTYFENSTIPGGANLLENRALSTDASSAEPPALVNETTLYNTKVISSATVQAMDAMSYFCSSAPGPHCRPTQVTGASVDGNNNHTGIYGSTKNSTGSVHMSNSVGTSTSIPTPTSTLHTAAFTGRATRSLQFSMWAKTSVIVGIYNILLMP